MKALLFSFLILVFAQLVSAQSATVTWASTYQTMDGFGGQTGSDSINMTAAQADSFFSTTNGIGMFVRTVNTVDGSIPDLATLKLAVARGAQVQLTFQSPPASMKDNGSFTIGGSLLPSNYDAFATYIVNYLHTFAAKGIPIAVLSVANEPNIKSSGLGACLWTAAQLEDFIKNHLGPALATAGLAPKLMLAENSAWFDKDLVSACLNDSGCAQYVSIVAGHGYGLGSTDGTNNNYCCHAASAYPLAATKGKKLWMSEINGGLLPNGSASWFWDPSMADGLVWAHNIHDYLTVANVSAWEYWELAYNSTYNFGLTNASFSPAKRFYVVGNWSKYVRPGWLRIGATASPASGVYITAFKDATSGDFAIVAVNRNSSPVAMDFSLSGFPTVTSVTPTLTSASDDLADRASEDVSGGAFSYSLPESSVVTFHGTASSSVSKNPTPPTHLAATVQ